MEKHLQSEGTLVLRDKSGNVYAIPQELLEQYKLPGDEMGRYSRLFEHEVSGYAMSTGEQASGPDAAGATDAAMLFDSLKRDWIKEQTSSDIFPLLLGIIVTTHPELKEKPIGGWPT